MGTACCFQFLSQIKPWLVCQLNEARDVCPAQERACTISAYTHVVCWQTESIHASKCLDDRENLYVELQDLIAALVLYYGKAVKMQLDAVHVDKHEIASMYDIVISQDFA